VRGLCSIARTARLVPARFGDSRLDWGYLSINLWRAFPLHSGATRRLRLPAPGSLRGRQSRARSRPYPTLPAPGNFWAGSRPWPGGGPAAVRWVLPARARRL